MKTITEFAAPTLKTAGKTRQELITAGKTPEELPQAMGEALKLEGDKLKNLLTALEIVGTKIGDLKRVVVFSINEGEKLPPKAEQKEGTYFLAEYFPPLNPPKPRGGRFDSDRKGGGRGGRDGGRGGGRGDKRGDKRSDSRGDSQGRADRGPSGPRRGPPAPGGPTVVVIAHPGHIPVAPRSDRPARSDRPSRPPRPARPPREPEKPFTGPRGVIVPRVKTPEQAPAPVVETAAPEQPKTNE